MIIWIEQLYESAIQGKVEPSTGLNRSDLMRLTAERAGYGYRNGEAEGLSSSEDTEIGLYVEEGYRDFLQAFEWSFNKPLATSVLWAAATGTTDGTPSTTLTATSGTAPFHSTMIGATVTFTSSGTTYEISGYTSTTVVTLTTDASIEGDAAAFTIATVGENRLPDNFGGLSGDVYFQSNDGRWLPILQVGLAEIMQLQQSTTGTSRPTHLAIMPLTIGSEVGQRFAMLVWQIPDSDYTIRYQYHVLPDKLTANSYPYGGSQHAETIKYACLAAMDRSKFSNSHGYDAQYQKYLAGSIRRDKRVMGASEVGFSRGYHGSRFYYDQTARNITVGGVSFP